MQEKPPDQALARRIATLRTMPIFADLAERDLAGLVAASGAGDDSRLECKARLHRAVQRHLGKGRHGLLHGKGTADGDSGRGSMTGIGMRVVHVACVEPAGNGVAAKSDHAAVPGFDGADQGGVDLVELVGKDFGAAARP